MLTALKRRTKTDVAFDIILDLIMFLILIVTLYPMAYILSISFSSQAAIETGKVVLWPIGFSLSSYQMLFFNQLFLRSYGNTIFYTTVGTAYSLILTLFGGYALSRKKLIGKKFFMILIVFTMFFNGGLIPTFMVVNQLGMYNSWMAIIFPCAISAFNLIIVKTFMEQIPDSMEESAKIDGANDIIILFKIYIPMCIPVIATVGLFYAVGKWNDYYSALIYLSKQELYPVQLVIRDLLITMTDNTVNQNVNQGDAVNSFTPMGFKAAVMMVTMVPIMAVYPFLQRYFVKGIMLGAVKG